MPTGAEYEARIKTYNWDDLIRLWSQIQTGDTPDWDAGKALEYLIIRAFQLEGAEVLYPYSVRIDDEELEQIDGAIYSAGLNCLIECKDTSTTLNVEPIAKLRNQLLRRPAAAIGCVFSSSGFTEAAFTLAKYIAPQTILLWEQGEIYYCLRNQFMRLALLKKYRYCIEQGVPNYNINGRLP
jgi:Restriction endonuclease